MGNTFEIKNKKIYINGKRTKIISGSVHYFRIHPCYWKDRLLKLKEMGCNCIETYVAMNLHEKEEGVFDFSGWLDVSSFLRLAQDLGLYVILRPGPYICSEWDLGGLPYWILKDKNIHLRTSDPLYLKKITPFLIEVCKQVKNNLFSHGGNILFWQIENEYGSYGSDKAYLEYLKNLFVENGVDCEFISSDGDTAFLLQNGSCDGVMESVNYRYDSPRALKALKAFNPSQPGAVLELWNGRGYRVGDKFIRRDLKEVAFSLKTALKGAEIINLYPAHGGTNFGLYNGALDLKEEFLIQPNSYDCDAPINEYGQRTKKYYVEQKIIHDYLNKPIENTCEDVLLTAFGKAKLVDSIGYSNFRDSLSKTISSPYLLSMEEVGQRGGVIVYSTTQFIDKKGAILHFPIIHDVMHLYVDGKYVKTFYRDEKNPEYFLRKHGNVELCFVLESLGHINYGFNLKDYKGLVGDIVLEDLNYKVKAIMMNYRISSMSFDALPLSFDGSWRLHEPVFYKYEIDVDEPKDTILHLKGFTRGLAFINGFNLGRHFDAKYSQNKLYIPYPLLKKGKNEILVFDILMNKKEKLVELTNQGLKEQK